MEKIGVIFKIGVLLAAWSCCSCTDYNYYDSGLADGKHDCSMWEYLHSDHRNWDSTVIMIEHAGLKEVFEGNSVYGQITFFGITSKSILLYMLYHNDELDQLKASGAEVHESLYWHRVTDIPADLCRRMLLQLIIPKRLMLADIPRGNFVTTSEGLASDAEIGGGMYKTLGNGELFLYTFQEDYKNIAGKGEIRIYMVSRSKAVPVKNAVASCNIETLNGVVHSLEYDFLLTDI